MENKINIAEILKNCPIGMELDCTTFNNVTFQWADNYGIWIGYIDLDNNNRIIHLTCYGTVKIKNMDIETKCVIFPKGKTTWDGFVPPCKFKDGDIVATNTGNWIGITTGGISDEEIPTYCIIDPCNNLRIYFDKPKSWNFSRLATKEEKAKLFQTIKNNGYHWNTETKTLEKLDELKFKVGDRLIYIHDKEMYMDEPIYVKRIECNRYILNDGKYIPFYDQDDFISYEIYNKNRLH